MPADRFSTATRLRALGSQAAERVYRAQSRRMRTPPGSRLTGRAAVLALVLCSLVVVLAYPARQYVTQRSQIADQRQQAQEAREEVKRLREERARWHDPAYVEQQARLHLHYVRPGETGYVRPDGSADDTRDGDEGPADRPWYQNLWRSIDLSDSDG
ncbi:FtsB family cell division protein [Streptomyces sulphureus]|uniref:FtsB family cell division protein n=1 Tax=Streptomyces sulphureus TaxID=47758 RepID=UPI00036229DA|nr:septum formation initiator family protein [Streptomyces sulphureus]